MPVPLDQLPTEVLYNIFVYVLPLTAVKLQQVSRKFYAIIQPLLWRHYCRTLFKHWSPERNIDAKFDGDVDEVDWKKILVDRLDIARRVNREIELILSEQRHRLESARYIAAHGNDAKDTLQEIILESDGTEDVLARRFYCNAVLALMDRKTAIQAWEKLSREEHVPLEKALAGFDMFVSQRRTGDQDEISKALDTIAGSFKHEVHGFAAMTTRRKAAAVAEYLRTYHFVGIRGNEDENYHNLENSFLGIALQDPDHSSLPLISVAIYCCVAQRVGLDAHPCGFPFHMLAIVKPQQGVVMVGEEVSERQPETPLYMDPFRSSSATDVENLKSQLVGLGIAPSKHAAYLDASSTAEVVRRSAKNIITSVQSPRHGTADRTSSTNSFPDMEAAFYASLWAFAILSDGESDGDTANILRAQFMSPIIDRVQLYFPLDLSLIEEHALPLFSDHAHYDEIRRNVTSMHRLDNLVPLERKVRMTGKTESVRFKVGQFFQHKRYDYFAVIIGWDVECQAGQAWVSTMGIEHLERGQQQSFYHVKVEDGSRRYVAEDNIKIVDQEPSQKLMTLAGQYFKRWDENTRMFISNIKDEYPDD